MPIKKRFPSDKQEQYIVRFPDGMRDRIKDAAAANKRSMNAEIIHRLQDSLDFDDYEKARERLPRPEDEAERLALFAEDNERRARERNRALATHGVDNILAEVVDRLERLEKKLDEK